MGSVWSKVEFTLLFQVLVRYQLQKQRKARISGKVLEIESVFDEIKKKTTKHKKYISVTEVPSVKSKKQTNKMTK